MPAASQVRTDPRRIDHGLIDALQRAIDAADLVALLRERVGLTQEEIGRATGVSSRSVRNWEHGTALRQGAEDRLRELGAVVEALAPTLAPRGITQWLNAKSTQLDGERALDALGQGRAAAVWGAVDVLTGGGYV